MNFEEGSALQRALLEEQAFVESAYSALDSETEHYAQQLADVRAQGASGTPAARSERDSFATHYESFAPEKRRKYSRFGAPRLY